MIFDLFLYCDSEICVSNESIQLIINIKASLKFYTTNVIERWTLESYFATIPITFVYILSSPNHCFLHNTRCMQYLMLEKKQKHCDIALWDTTAACCATCTNTYWDEIRFQFYLFQISYFHMIFTFSFSIQLKQYV